MDVARMKPGCVSTGVVLLGLAMLVAGCGTIQHEDVSNTGRRQHYKTSAGRPLRVMVGKVTTTDKLDAEVSAGVARYLIDQGKAALGQHDIFAVADTHGASTSLLDRFMQTDSAPAATAEVDATLEIRVTDLREKKGATVRVGIVSRQSKMATATVETTLRLANGKVFAAKATGTNTKGAVGAIAMVNRKAMDKAGVWALDGSMAGGACTKALAQCIDELARAVHREVRRLTPDAAERFLRPASLRPGR